jgi:hypothetical protein
MSAAEPSITFRLHQLTTTIISSGFTSSPRRSSALALGPSPLAA